MTPERWQQIGRIFKGALERERDGRAAFLEQACGSDNELRREIERLLSSDEQAGSFMEASPSEASPSSVASLTEPATTVGLVQVPDPFIGRVVSNYRLEERLAAGGMGVLYRATDLKLGRSVAVKVLSRHLALDDTAKVRFLREARAASALDHPNIGAIHHIEDQDGELFIVMALYQGETLKQRLQKGPLPVPEALEVLRQVALGLEAAYRAGIVHRDIKPANLFRTDEGIVKILDFGLAKLVSESQAATMTQSGEPMGTVLYMSPEQLRAEPVDGRSDLWSLGVVAHELLAGVSPFQADSGAATAMRILSEEPLALASVSDVPLGLAELVSQLLRKAPAERPQSASEVLSHLDHPSSPSRIRAKPRVVLALAAILAGALLASFAGLNLGNWRDRLFASSASASIRSLAVLPLDNFSRDPEQDYFADGMTGELIANLAKIRTLRVISRTSVMKYKGARKPLPEIARELDVEGVVEGSVQREGNRVRITVQLIQARTEKLLWAETYERDFQDVLTLQGDVARAIVKEIKVLMTPEEQMRLGATRQVNRQAYEAYLKGLYYWNKVTAEGAKKGGEYFEQAIKIDPSYAPAYASFAFSQTQLAWLGRDVPRKELYQKAETAALKALELDPTLGEPHSALGNVRSRHEWNFAGAEKEYKRSLDLNPNSVIVHANYGLFLTLLGRSGEAIAELKHAEELDPLSVRSLWSLAFAYSCERQYDLANQELQKLIEIDPSYHYAHDSLGTNYRQQGRYEEAIGEFAKASELRGEKYSVDPYTYAVMGKREEALKGLTDMEREFQQGNCDCSIGIAATYARLGEKDKAFEWLEKVNRETTGSPHLKVIQTLDPLRSDSRFPALLRRIGFPP